MVPAVIAVAALSALAAGAYLLAYRRESRPDRILALLYHRLVTDEEYARCPPTEKLFSITERRFREQMDFLGREGYHAVTLQAVLDFIRGGPALPARPVLVTFDDGCVSVREKALPILAERGMPATLFVTTDPGAWVFSLGSNAQRRVTAEEMRACEAAGIAIGSHSVTHGPLESMDEREIARELGESRRHLEEALGHEVPFFGVPLNWYGPKVRAAAVAAGYRAVCTSDNGTICRDSDPLHLRRFIVEGTFTLDEFARNLEPGAIVQRRLVNAVKRLPARLLGPRIWLPLRRRLFASFLGRYFALRYVKRVVAGGLVTLALVVVLGVWLLARS